MSTGSRVAALSWLLVLGAWAAPVSITASELFLSGAALWRIGDLMTGRARLPWPRVLWLWLLWAGLQTGIWLGSGDLQSGWSEIRHLLLVAALFLAFSGFESPAEARFAWQGIFVTAGISSLILTVEYFYKLQAHAGEIAEGGDPGFYLRSGGLVGHWMIYGTVEVLVVAALVAYWKNFGATGPWIWLVTALNAAGVVFSLTRMAWVTCAVLVAVGLSGKRPRWLWLVPPSALAVCLALSAPIRSRAAGFFDFEYYSNVERVQMLRVGWKMIRDNPLKGVGPGNVGPQYRSYLAAGETLPAYHGHLHNNFVQLGAQFGAPSLLAAILFLLFLCRTLMRRRREARNSRGRFLPDVALLALGGFCVGGLFEYTYGHSLALILLSLAVVPALTTPADKFIAPAGSDRDMGERV